MDSTYMRGEFFAISDVEEGGEEVIASVFGAGDKEVHFGHHEELLA